MIVELDELYNQEKMWDMLGHKEYTRDVVLWASKMKQLVICDIKKQPDIVSDLSVQMDDRKSFIDDGMNVFCIKYSKIFKMKEVGFGLFITTFFQKCVEFAKSGLISSVLVMAHYHPELVCDKIHPIIGRDCKYYQDSDHTNYKKKV